MSDIIMQSEFVISQLQNIASVQTGPFGSQLHQRDYVDIGTPIITVEHLGENRIIHENLPCVSDEDKDRLSKYQLLEGDIVFSRVGSVDRCAYVKKEEEGWLFSGRCLRIRSNPQLVSSRYLSFYFGHPSFKTYIRQVAVGATMPSLNTSLMGELEIPLPPLQTQKKIASILSSLDDKIEINTRMNKVLEEIARALFHRWFVEFEFPDAEGRPYKSSGGKMVDSDMGLVPEGWDVLSFKDILKIQNEKSNDPTIPEYSVTNLGIYPRDEKYKKKLSASESKNKIIYKFDLVFGMSREILNWGVMKDEIGGVSSAYNVFIIDKAVNPLFLESFMKNYLPYFKDIIKPAAREGQGIDRTALFLKNIYLPPKDILDQYYDMENTILSVVRNFEKENERLTKIRDTLLPKLMSGELSVPISSTNNQETGGTK